MFHIFNIFSSLLLIIICFDRVFANNYEYKRILNVNSTAAEMPSLFPSFDVQLSQIRFLKVSNDDFSMHNAGDPVTFILVGNELYRLTERSLDAIAVFTDTNDQPKSEQTYFNINDIQACHWDDKLIFIVNVQDVYNVYLLKVPAPNKNGQLTVLSPIQKIKKHGDSQLTMFFNLNGHIHCLLATTYLAERKSELRMLQWKHSFFQTVVTMSNKNYKIDRMLVQQSRNVIIFIENKKAESHDTIIHVYQYGHTNNPDNIYELEVKKIQMISTSIDLLAGISFTYDGGFSSIMYLVLCATNIPQAVIMKECEYYAWRTDSIEETTIFQRLNHLPLLEGLPLQNITPPFPDQQRILATDDVLAFQMNKAIMVVDDKTSLSDTGSVQPSFIISCSLHNLVDVFILKTRAVGAKEKFNLKLVCLHVCLDSKECKGIKITLRSHFIFEKTLLDKTSDSRIQATHLFNTRELFLIKLHRIRDILTGLKDHLISEQEEYLHAMHIKEDNLNRIMNIIDMVRDRASIKGEVAAKKVTLVSGSKNSVGTVVLKPIEAHDNRNITELFHQLKMVNENIKSQLAKQHYVNKRSLNSSDHWSGQSIYVKRLYLNGEDHPFKDVVKRSNGFNRFRLNGKIQTKKLIVGCLLKLDLNDKLNSTRVKRSEFASLQHSKINVKSINGIEWDAFVKSLYRKGVSTAINGNLFISFPTTTQSILTHQINGVPIANLMTLGTDQVIDSNLFVKEILAPGGVNAKIFNDYKDFAHNVALLGSDNVINGRIKIAVLNVRNRLQLADHEDGEMTEHIIGTHLRDLTQIYSKHVTIRGSLTLTNVSVSSIQDNFFSPPIDFNVKDATLPVPAKDEALIIVGSVPFQLASVLQDYWMKSVDQNIGDVIFHQPISMPQITTNLLNSHPANDHFILDDRFDTFSNSNSSHLSIEFVNDVEIFGNLKTNQNTSSVLGKLKDESIPRLGGGRIKFTSPITFRDRLIVHHVTTHFNTDNLVRKSSDQTSVHSDNQQAISTFNSGVQKQFTSKLSIEKDVTFLNSNETHLKLGNFNEFKNLTHLFESMILFNKQPIVGALVFDGNFSADALYIERFIDNSSGIQIAYDINTILASIHNFRENRIRSLTVSGNTRFKRVNIHFLNELDLKKYFSSIISTSDIEKGKRIQIGGRKTFLSDLSTSFSTVKKFNKNINPDDWIRNAFSKQSAEKLNEQVITGSNWHINLLFADNIEAQTINDIRITSMNNEKSHIIVVDNNPKNVITIQSDISFSGFMKIGSNSELNTTQMRPCNVYKLFADTISLTQNNWREMNIVGNVKIFSSDISSSSSARGSLTDLFKNAVLYDADQTILMNGNAQFKCHPDAEFTFNRITTALNDNLDEPLTLINDVNLVSIFKDAATTNIISLNGRTQTTVIRGLKQFVNTTCDGNETIVTGKMDVKTINEVNILLLNQTMMYRNTDELSIVPGQQLLFIQSPTINTLRISSNQTINDLYVDDLFFVHNPRLNRSSPSMAFARVDQLSAPYQIHSNENLELNIINEISLKYFLENRVKLYDISGSANMNNPQMMDGFITFENLILMGRGTRVERINDVICDDAILKKSDENQEISGHKIISGSSFRINRPCHTWRMNGVDFVSAYSQSIFLNQRQNLDNLSIKYPHQLDAPAGVLVDKMFNGIIVPNVSDEITQYRVGSTVSNVTTIEQNEAFRKFNYIDTTTDFIIKYNPLTEIDIASVSLKDVPLSVDSFYVNMINGSEISLCPVQYHIRPPQENTKEISMQRAKINQRILTVSVMSNITIQVRTVFPPEPNYYNHCQISHLSNTDFKSTIYVNHQQIFTLPDSIVEGLHVFSANGKLYFLLHLYERGLFIYTQNTKNMWSIVDEIKWPTDSLQWHNIKVLHWNGLNILVASSTSQSSAAQMETSSTDIYIFNEEQQHFVRKNSIFGDYNIIGDVKIPKMDTYANTTTSKAYDLYLIMAMQGKSHINIYKAFLERDTIQFVQTQGFELDEGIESMSFFYEYSIYYIAAISSSGRFRVYQHLPSSLKHPLVNLNTDAWHSTLSGHWKNGRALIPLALNKRLYLLVMADQQQFIDNYRVDGNRSGTNIAKLFKLIYY